MCCVFLCPCFFTLTVGSLGYVLCGLCEWAPARLIQTKPTRVHLGVATALEGPLDATYVVR